MCGCDGAGRVAGRVVWRGGRVAGRGAWRGGTKCPRDMLGLHASWWQVGARLAMASMDEWTDVRPGWRAGWRRGC